MYSKYRTPYKEQEEEKYYEWVNDSEEIKYPIYVISGEPFWKKETIDRMSKSIGKRPEHVNENLKKYTDKMRYKSLASKKHFVLFENKNNRLRDSDYSTLRAYISEPSENGVLVISLKDWEEKRNFLNSFKMLRRSTKVKYFEMDFTSDHFKSLYVRECLQRYEYVIENEKVRNDLIRNLIMNMGELEDNLLTLQSLDTPIISKDDIKQSIEDYTDNNISKMYDSLAKVNRKKVPYEILNDLLSEGRQPLTILRGIRTHFNLLYQAKYLKIRGILRANDLEERKKEIYLSEGIIFTKPDIWEISKRRRNRLLDDCEELSIREIIYVLNLIETYVTKIRSRSGDKYVYTEYIKKEDLIGCVIEIMNRREYF